MQHFLPAHFPQARPSNATLSEEWKQKNKVKGPWLPAQNLPKV